MRWLQRILAWPPIARGRAVYARLLGPLTPLWFILQVWGIISVLRWIAPRMQEWLLASWAMFAMAFGLNLLLYGIRGHKLREHLPPTRREWAQLIASVLGMNLWISLGLTTFVLVASYAFGIPVAIWNLRGQAALLTLSLILVLLLGFITGGALGLLLNGSIRTNLSRRRPV